MLIDTKKRIRFIINPISGTRDKDYIETYIIKNIDHNRFFFDIVYTEYPQHAVKIASEAAAKSYDAVIAIGGDGSVNEVSKALVHTNTALGIIPNGSGNGLAHYLKIPLNIQKAIKIINEFNIIPIDTASINGHLFVSIAGLGFDALIADDFSRASTRGLFSYLGIIIKNYLIYYRKKYIMYVGKKKIKLKAMMITFANSNQFGYNSVIAPDACINDGLIDVCIIDKVPVYEAGIFPLLMFLKRVDLSKRIEIFKCKELTLIQSKDRPIHIDGDPIYAGKKINLKVMPASLKVVLPKQTLDQLATNFNE